MMWYHLSLNDNLPPRMSTLRIPKFAYSEPEEHCFCVCPTVWQCAVSIPREGPMHIYEVTVKKPDPAAVPDFKITHEHRITQEVLKKEGGSFPVTLAGELSVDGGLKTYLKIACWKMGMRFSAEQERKHLWDTTTTPWGLQYEDAGHLQEALKGKFPM